MTSISAAEVRRDSFRHTGEDARISALRGSGHNQTSFEFERLMAKAAKAMPILEKADMTTTPFFPQRGNWSIVRVGFSV